MEQAPKERNVILIYIGQMDRSGTHYYFVLNEKDLHLNDGRSTESLKLKTNAYNSKLFTGRPGAMHPAILKGANVSYKAKSLPVGWWKNKENVIEWQTKNDAIELIEKNKRDLSKMISQNSFRNSLDPIKKAFDYSSTQERQAIIANIIQYLNS